MQISEIKTSSIKNHPRFKEIIKRLKMTDKIAEKVKKLKIFYNL